MPRPRRSPTGIARILLTIGLASSPAGATGYEEAIADVAEHLARFEKLGFAGVVVVVAGDEPLLARGYGLADRERGLPWTPATVSTIGSITKQFTGAAILALAEEGRLALDDRIDEYFSAVPEDKRPITLHHLLTHSSGIVDVDGYGDWDPLERDEFVRLALEQELAFAPGESYAYSNAGYSLLGAIVEQLTGGPYESYLRRRLLIPAGLFETGYVLPAWGEGRMAQGYRDGELWGTVLGRPLAADGPYWVLRANGGIHATAWDMVRWARALLAGAALAPASMALYWSPHVDEGGGESFYGYGWVVDDVDGVRVIHHNGGNGIFFADLGIVPAADLVVFLMTNVAAEFGASNQLLSRIGRRLAAGEALPAVPDVVAADAAALAAWAGRYEVDGGGALLVTPGEARLDVEALDPRAFTALLSSRPADHERAARLTARIVEISAGASAGDFEPLARAYRGEVTAAYLAGRWEQTLAALEESYGELRTQTVLGTALGLDRDVTLVRLEFADGETHRAYVWDPEQSEHLLGVSQRGLDHVLHVHPVAGGGWASWDARWGTSLPVELTESDGAMRLTIHAGTEVVARRDPP